MHLFFSSLSFLFLYIISSLLVSLSVCRYIMLRFYPILLFLKVSSPARRRLRLIFLLFLPRCRRLTNEWALLGVNRAPDSYIYSRAPFGQKKKTTTTTAISRIMKRTSCLSCRFQEISTRTAFISFGFDSLSLSRHSSVILYTIS